MKCQSHLPGILNADEAPPGYAAVLKESLTVVERSQDFCRACDYQARLSRGFPDQWRQVPNLRVAGVLRSGKEREKVMFASLEDEAMVEQLKEDNARLRAEIERLTAELHNERNQRERLIDDMRQERDRAIDGHRRCEKRLHEVWRVK